MHTQLNASEGISSEQSPFDDQKKENVSTDINPEQQLKVSSNLTSKQQLKVISNLTSEQQLKEKSNISNEETTSLQNLNKTLLDNEHTTEETPSSDTDNSLKTDESAQANNVNNVFSEETSKISAITNINIKRLKEYQPQPSRLLGTSTSTEISHETEICYRGRCIKTKTPEVDQISIE